VFSIEDEHSIAKLLVEAAQASNKPIIGVIDGGRLYDPLRDHFLLHNVPVFPVCDRAVAALARYSEARLRVEEIRATNEHF
jgi:hypothetical protein